MWTATTAILSLANDATMRKPENRTAANCVATGSRQMIAHQRVQPVARARVARAQTHARTGLQETSSPYRIQHQLPVSSVALPGA